MNTGIERFNAGPLALAIALALPMEASADAAYDALKSQVENLKKQLEQVQKTLKSYEKTSASKNDVAKLEKKVAEASEWKSPNTLIHMSGYADVGYTDSKDSSGSFNVGSFSPIFHFQYRDLVMLESELEFEVEADGGTNVATGISDRRPVSERLHDPGRGQVPQPDRTVQAEPASVLDQ